MSARSSILVADPDVRGRLWIVDVLRSDFAISIPGPGEGPLRACRRLRPQCVLLAVPRGRSMEAIRTCRSIKTDSNEPALVGILDQWGRISRPARVLSSAMADGYLGGQVTPDEVLSFTQDLLERKNPVVSKAPPPRFFERFWKRR